MEKIRKNSNRLSYLLDEIKQRLLQYYDDHTRSFIHDRTMVIRGKINTIIDEKRQVSKLQLVPHIKTSLIHVVIDEFEPYRLSIEKDIKGKYNEDIQSLNSEVSQIINDIYRFSAEVFQISQSIQLHQDAWQYKSQFYYKTWEVEGSLDVIQNVIILLLPRSVYTKFIKRSINKSVLEKLEQQWGRFRGDLFYGLNDNNLKFLYEFDKILNRTANEISQLIQKHVTLKQMGEQAFNENMLKHERLAAKVKQVSSEIQEIKNFWESKATGF